MKMTKPKKKPKPKLKLKIVKSCFLCEADAVGSVEQYNFCAGHLPWAKVSAGAYHKTFHLLMSNINFKYKRD